MTEAELKLEIKQAKLDCQSRINQAYKTYAEANRQYQIGDVVTDHYHTIRITGLSSIWIDSTSGLPSQIYRGVELKKDLTPTKRQRDTTIYETNIIRKETV